MKEQLEEVMRIICNEIEEEVSTKEKAYRSDDISNLATALAKLAEARAVVTEINPNH